MVELGASRMLMSFPMDEFPGFGTPLSPLRRAGKLVEKEETIFNKNKELEGMFDEEPSK